MYTCANAVSELIRWRKKAAEQRLALFSQNSDFKQFDFKGEILQTHFSSQAVNAKPSRGLNKTNKMNSSELSSAKLLDEWLRLL